MTDISEQQQELCAAIAAALAVADGQQNHLVAALLDEALDAADCTAAP